MFHTGPRGPSLVSEEFNQTCVDNHVEVTVKALPNPGDPYRAMRMLEFKSFTDSTVKVMQYNDKMEIHYIPSRGTLQILLKPNEPLPYIEKVDNV